MMICPQCHLPISDNEIACKVCADRKSQAALLRSQVQFLPRVLAGSLTLKLTPRYGRAKPHLVLYTDDSHSWCWEPVRGTLKWEYYDEQLITKGICDRCAARFLEVREAAQAESQR